MITLDGNNYITNRIDYADKPGSPSTYQRGLTGLPLIVESGIMTQEFTVTLNVSQAEWERLKLSFIKCHTTGVYLDYIDERDVTWSVGAGIDTPNHKFSTGVWFGTMSDPKPVTEALFDPYPYGANINSQYDIFKRFTVQIGLVVNSISLT